MGDVADAVKMHYTTLPKGLFTDVKIRNHSEEPCTKQSVSLTDF